MSESIGGHVGEPIEPIRCCRMQIRTGTLVIVILELIFVALNFLLKALGYLETLWNWELLFLVIDSIAVLSLFYGVWNCNAAPMQPFVVLNIMTISLLGLGTLFFIAAGFDKDSYAGQYVEMEMRDSAHTLAAFLRVEQKDVVCIVGGFTAFIIGLSTLAHLWFFKVIVQCAQYYRELSKITDNSLVVLAEISLVECDKTGTV